MSRGTATASSASSASEDVGTWRFDAEEEAVELNEAARALHGLSPAEPVDFETLLRQYPDRDREGVRAVIERAIEEGETFTYEVECSLGEDTRHLELRGGPHHEEGAIVGVYGTVEDGSDQAKLEQRVEVLRDASQRLMGADAEEEVARILADASKNILGYVNTTIRLVDEEDVLRTVISTEECVSKAGERPDYPVAEDTPAARTYRTGEPELQQDHGATEDDRDRGELMSGLYVPIGDHGVMSSGDTAIAAFDDSDLEASELLGQLGSEALARIVSERELQAQNERLTEFIQNMTANIEEVTATTETVDDLAADAVEQANEGDEAIESIAEQMDDIESRVENAATQVEKLNDVVAEIDEFVDMIDDIADQTNMLALNANIEAARAGDAGQGFAVVANEVKDLAERTQEATDEIESLIRNVERHTGRATESIRETTEYASDGRESAEMSSALLGDIVDAIAETEDGVAEINRAMGEQAESIEDVAATLEE